MSHDPNQAGALQKPETDQERWARTAAHNFQPHKKMTAEEKEMDKQFKKFANRPRLRMIREATGFKVSNYIVHAKRYGVDREEAMKLVQKKLNEKERKEQCLI